MSLAGSSSPIGCSGCSSAGRPGRPGPWKSEAPAMRVYFIEICYLAASILFVLGLRGLSHPESARRGMQLAEFGMLMAILGTLMHREIIGFEWIIAGLLLGSTIGLGIGLWVPMTAMPQRTAFSHACGALAASLVGIAEYS